MARWNRDSAWATAAPVVVAVSIFGVSFGVLAGAAGIPQWQAILMSATVFAGSAQFAAVSIIAGGGAAATVVLSGALLNARYLATGAAAAAVLPGGRIGAVHVAHTVVPRPLRLPFGRPQGPHQRAVLASASARALTSSMLATTSGGGLASRAR